jgi:hypothetical protein
MYGQFAPSGGPILYAMAYNYVLCSIIDKTELCAMAHNQRIFAMADKSQVYLQHLIPYRGHKNL